MVEEPVVSDDSFLEPAWRRPSAATPVDEEWSAMLAVLNHRVEEERRDREVRGRISLAPSAHFQDTVDHILPLMTQPFDFMKNKSIIPEWQEQIIFNECFSYFVEQSKESPKVIFFFEILDFVTMEEARANHDIDKHEQGFRKIAWAFLKLVGTNEVLNIDSKLCLQLFCPPPRAKRQPKTIEVVEWWRKYPRTKYASTLYVTIKGIKFPEHVDPCIRSMMALQEERGSTSYSELQIQTQIQIQTKPPVLRWSRLPGQICRIPNKPILAFRGGQMGCLTVLFSHAGTILAAACADRDAFPVVVYEIPSGKVLAAFSGHLKIVYDLCWFRDDRSLLSASSDGTVREWNVETLTGTAQKVLPHPCFVYCAQYHPTAQNLVVTGVYDGLIRVWRLDVDDVNGHLLQEFEGHGSFVNAGFFFFDSEGPNPSLPPPSFLSPHSKLQLSRSLAEQLIPQAALGTQHCGFSPVGQRVKGASPFRLKTTLPDHIASGIHMETDPTPVQQVVRCVYDYKANHSDELTICHGDVIHVLYKDNENWCFGCLVNGQQGYFLASNVADQRLPSTFALHQFASRNNRSTENAIATAILTTLTHMEQKNCYAKLLFIDFSSAFNTIIPNILRSCTSPAATEKLKSNLKDTSHPAHYLSQLLPSGRQYRRDYLPLLCFQSEMIIPAWVPHNASCNLKVGFFVGDFQEEVAQSLGAPMDLPEEIAERSTPTRVSAAISSSGELSFLSEPTLSDTEPELASAK
ncbi:uncharacterized protein KZ484_012931 [Pholidichthys leucotaenia]